jgi:hypothetical protein
VTLALARLGIPTALLLLAVSPGCARSAPQLSLDDPHSPLQLVRKIELPDVRGRIDHLALDTSRGHLFVAEYGNGSVDDIDLHSGQISGRVTGLHEPQGVAWLPRQQEIAVACGDGSVRFYRGADLQHVAAIQLGKDADNERIDLRNGNLVVGYGSGALAVIDPSMHRVMRQLMLPAHPEAFAIIGPRVFVNLPDARRIAVANLDEARVTSALGTGKFGSNYPMGSDVSSSRFAVAYRSPSTLVVMDAKSGGEHFSVPVCGDADDLYFHAHRIIVICGEGVVELVDETSDHGSIRVATERGARTGLLDPERKRLFVAVPAGRGPAAIWELSFR